MAQLTVQEIVKTGLNPAYAAATAGGDSVPVGSKTFIHVKNGHSAPQTVTVNSQQPCDQGVDHNLVVAVPNAGERLIGPLEGPRFADANQLAQITYDSVTALTIAAIKVP